MDSVERVELELYSRAVNAGVVRMPGRQFPGLVLQGDSLSIMLGMAEEIFERTRTADDPELSETAAGLQALLQGYLRHYETVLRGHDLALPYFRRENEDSTGDDPAPAT